MISAHIDGVGQLEKRLSRTAALMRSSIYVTIAQLAIKLQRHVMADKLSGQVLRTRTGTLRRSITYRVERVGDSGAAGVVGTNVRYARIHEYGGTIPAHDIVPRRGTVLAFDWKGKTVFARRVHIPDVKMPERSFLRSALRDMLPEIRQELAKVPGVAWQEAGK